MNFLPETTKRLKKQPTPLVISVIMNINSTLHNPYFNSDYYLFVFVGERLPCTNFDLGNKHTFRPPFNGDHSYSWIDIHYRISNFKELQFYVQLAYVGCFAHR